MAFGFPAYHTELYTPPDGHGRDLYTIVEQLIASRSWAIKERGPKRIKASTGLGFRSWGEHMFIDFLPNGKLSITSKCALVTQCFDWGKNQENVQQFIVDLHPLLV